MKHETLAFWTGVVLFLYIGFLLGMLVHRERVYRDFEDKSHLIKVYHVN